MKKHKVDQLARDIAHACKPLTHRQIMAIDKDLGKLKGRWQFVGRGLRVRFSDHKTTNQNEHDAIE